MNKVTVVGLGVSGKAASLLLKEKGSDVYATDLSESEDIIKTAQELRRHGISVETGRHTEAFIKDSELVIASPGVQDSSPVFTIAGKNSIPIVSEIELGWLFCKAPIIAVTGTNGKSTVTTLIGLILEASNKKAVVCGNIGEAFSACVSKISEEQVVVLEVSSFQLKRIERFRPKVSVITNITQNHFDWHVDYKEYFDCKKKIYKNQKEDDFCILNYDDESLRMLEKRPGSKVLFFSIEKKVRGAYFEDSSFILNIDENPLEICSIDDIRLRGDHNISNILCSCLAAHLLGATFEGMKKALSRFQALDHRIQHVAEIDGVEFRDDSKATTVDACRVALLSCEGKVILIAGGRDKGSDFSTMKDIITQRVKALILIGESKEKIRAVLGDSVKTYDCPDMDRAVFLSRKIAEEGDIVLLSPMCASFDMYKDYKERGDSFKEAVLKLKTMSCKR